MPHCHDVARDLRPFARRVLRGRGIGLLPPGPGHLGTVPQRPDAGMPRHGAARIHDDATVVATLGVERADHRPGRDAGRPDQHRGRDALAPLQLGVVRAGPGDRGVQDDLDAPLL